MCPGSLLLGNAKSLLDDTAGTLTRGYRLLGPMFRIRAAWRQYTVIAGPNAGEFMAQGTPRNATVAAAGAHDVETLVTDRAGFDRLLAEGGGASGALAQAMRARAERFAS